MLVVLHHLSLNGGSLLNQVPFLREGWLFVDLFFVLSGYVIASVHCESEATLAAARRFLIRRFFRLWPLHFATLVAALLLELHDGTVRLPGYGLMLGMNLTMTQAWGLVSGSILNRPSWSISTEWAAYLLFAWICLVTPKRDRRIQLLGVVGLMSLTSLIVWRGGTLDGDLLFRVPRCLLSFALGAAVWAWCRNRTKLGASTAAMLQSLMGTAMLVLAAVATHEPRATLLMPLLSAGMIAAMVRDPGSRMKALLELPLPQWLGRHSYSIYLLHMPLFTFLVLVTPGGWPARSGPTNLWIVGALCILFALAGTTYALIEKPGRALGRRVADADFGKGSRSEAGKPAAAEIASAP